MKREKKKIEKLLGCKIVRRSHKNNRFCFCNLITDIKPTLQENVIIL